MKTSAPIIASPTTALMATAFRTDAVMCDGILSCNLRDLVDHVVYLLFVLTLNRPVMQNLAILIVHGMGTNSLGFHLALEQSIRKQLSSAENAHVFVEGCLWDP